MRLSISLYCALAVGLIAVALYMRLVGRGGEDLLTQGVMMVERLVTAALAFLFGEQRGRDRHP